MMNLTHTLACISVAAIISHHVVEGLVTAGRVLFDPHLSYPRITHLTLVVPPIDNTEIIVTERSTVKTH